MDLHLLMPMIYGSLKENSVLLLCAGKTMINIAYRYPQWCKSTTAGTVFSERMKKKLPILHKKGLFRKGGQLTNVSQKAVLIKRGFAISRVLGYNFAVLNCKSTAEIENFRIESNRVQPPTRADARN